MHAFRNILAVALFSFAMFFAASSDTFANSESSLSRENLAKQVEKLQRLDHSTQKEEIRTLILSTLGEIYNVLSTQSDIIDGIIRHLKQSASLNSQQKVACRQIIAVNKLHFDSLDYLRMVNRSLQLDLSSCILQTFTSLQKLNMVFEKLAYLG